MIVADASSIAKYILKEENWERIRQRLREACSLTLALLEISNAIWKHCVLYRAVSREEAMVMLEALRKLERAIVFEPFEKYLDEAVKIAIDEEIPVYDAVYLAQARKYGALLTSDERQRDVAEKLGIRTEYVE